MIEKRLTVKMFFLTINFAFSFFIGIFIPSIIGPKSYGDYSYSISTFLFFFQVLLFSINTAYVFEISQRKFDRKYLNFIYSIHTIIISLIILIISFISINTNLIFNDIFNKIEDNQIWILALFIAISMNFQNRLFDYSDSNNLTIPTEKIRLLSRITQILLLIIFIIYDKLNLLTFMKIMLFGFILFLVTFLVFIKPQVKTPSRIKLKIIATKFYDYIRPLLFFTVISSAYSYFGKFLVQDSSGSIEQGYFNLALQIAYIPSNLILGTMPLILSDLTEKYKKFDIMGFTKVINNAASKLFTFNCIFSVFIFINAREIVLNFIGPVYEDSVLTIKILSIYSILNSLGTISNSIFFSTNKTKQYNVINSSLQFTGLIILLILSFFVKINANILALSLLSTYSLKLIIQINKNLKFLKINFITKAKELLSILFIITGVYLIMANTIDSILINFSFSIFVLIILNFSFKDYFSLISVFKSNFQNNNKLK